MPAGVTLIAALLLILAASELFTNGIEWAGHRLRLGHGATGSLLAALGTALPETVVPIVALIQGGAGSEDVAIGAVLGGPFLLFTLGLGITGLAVALRRGRTALIADGGQLRRDLGTYGAGTAVLAVGLVLPHAARAAGAVLLLAIYARHVLVTLREDTAHGEAPEPLHLWRLAGGWRPAATGRRGPEDPHGAAVALQVLAAIGLLVISARIFVGALEDIAGALDISTLVLALVLVPVATELPETFNSVLWVRSGDDTLALGNVVGATAFQACIPGAVGLAFTGWRPGASGIASGAVTVAAALVTLALLRDGSCRGWRLAGCGLLWVAFVALALAFNQRLAPHAG